jgi:tRNA (guanine-N7-)-methyltransferase
VNIQEIKYRFYGRRKGHSLRRHHSELLSELLPDLRVNLADPLRDLGPIVWLEIGFGGGEHLAHQSQLHPDLSLIGAEPFVNGVAKLLAHIEARKLENIRIYDGDGRDILFAMPDNALDRVYLLYPDPWPKARHHQRRFVSLFTLQQIHRVMKPSGQFRFATDNDDYVEWTRELVSRHGGFAATRDDCVPFENWVETRYEAKARRDGRRSTYLGFEAKKP